MITCSWEEVKSHLYCKTTSMSVIPGMKSEEERIPGDEKQGYKVPGGGTQNLTLPKKHMPR